MNIEIFKKIQKQVNEDFVDNYKGETDILKVLDMSHLKDDVDALIVEMMRHPSVYAYWANLKRIAEDKYSKLVDRFEMYKSTKIRSTAENLKSQGVSHPTAKLIDAEFNKTYSEDSLYLKYVAAIDKWKQRKEILSICEKAIGSMDNQFRSLSYLLSNMMSNGLIQTASKRKPLSK